MSKSHEKLPVIVEESPIQNVAALLSGPGLRLRFGPFNVRITSDCPALINSLYPLYASFEVVDHEIAEFHVQIKRTLLLQKPFSNYVHFLVDGQAPFPAVPADQAFAALERGIKWAFAARASELLMLRTAVVERNGGVLLLPFTGAVNQAAALCILLAHSGYRLFSDTFGLMQPESRNFFPLPGLMTLSYESMSDISAFLPAVLPGTTLSYSEASAVVYVRPPSESVSRSQETAKARWIVLPQRVVDASPRLEPVLQSEVFLLLANNSLNYEMLGEEAFVAVTALVRNCACYRLIYSNPESALAILKELTDET